jgi:hypothetical protein
LLSEGLHNLSLQVEDAAGNLSAPLAHVFTVDTIAPVAPIIRGLTLESDSGRSPTDGVTQHVRPTLTGIAEAHSPVTVYAANGTTVRTTSSFGNPFGLALYDKTQANVAAVVSAVVQTVTASLAMCRDEADLKEWSASNGEMIGGLSDTEKQGVRKAYAARQTAIKSATNPFEQKAA